MSKPVRVEIDPHVKVSDVDLQAQFNTAVEVQGLSTTVNGIVSRVEDLTRQLTALSDSMRRPAAGGDGRQGNAPTGVAADIRTALDQLNQLHSRLVRECTMSYRCGAQLRENVNSLLNSISGPIARPSDGMLLLVKEYKAEAEKASSELNTIVTTSIKKVNDQLSTRPHIVTGTAIP
jgi:hypothetical protein